MVKIDLTLNEDWIHDQKFKRIGSYDTVKKFTFGWSSNIKHIFYAALSAQGQDSPSVKEEELDILLRAMILSKDLPPLLQTSQKHLPGKHPQITHGRGGGFSSRSERVWTGKRAEKGNLSKLQTGEIGERLAMHALSKKFGKSFDTLNVGVNNAPIDVISLDGKIAVEVKAGLTSNSSSARRWRATIGEPGKSEKAAIKRMTPSEKKEHNAWKREKILERKSSMLKKMSDELGVEIKPFVTGVIMSPDGKAGDVFLIPGFHLTASWSKFATDEFHIGSFNIGDVAEKLKHLPGRHQQLSHGGGRGISSPVPVDRENKVLSARHKAFIDGDRNPEATEVRRPGRDRLNAAFEKNGLSSVPDGTKKEMQKAREFMEKKGRSEEQIVAYIDKQTSINSFGGEYQGEWGWSSTDNGNYQDAIQLEAFERQGGRNYDGLSKVDTDFRPGTSKEHRKVAYDSIKSSTQEWFKENGFKPDDEITVYRGMGLGADVKGIDRKVGTITSKDSFSHNPLSSWSYEKKMAMEFAASNKTAGRNGKDAVTVAVTVKVKDIFSTAGSGFGKFEEGEVVLESSKIGDILMVDLQ